jgi:hypothetical protein
MVMGRVADITDDETEVEGHGQDDEETEDDLFQIHGLARAMGVGE